MSLRVPDTLMVDGHAFSWRRLCELRREQIDVLRKAQGEQPVLFPLIEDCRPSHERTASDRYLQPSLLDAAGIFEGPLSNNPTQGDSSC